MCWTFTWRSCVQISSPTRVPKCIDLNHTYSPFTLTPNVWDARSHGQCTSFHSRCGQQLQTYFTCIYSTSTAGEIGQRWANSQSAIHFCHPIQPQWAEPLLLSSNFEVFHITRQLLARATLWWQGVSEIGCCIYWFEMHMMKDRVTLYTPPILLLPSAWNCYNVLCPGMVDSYFSQWEQCSLGSTVPVSTSSLPYL